LAQLSQLECSVPMKPTGAIERADTDMLHDPTMTSGPSIAIHPPGDELGRQCGLSESPYCTQWLDLLAVLDLHRWRTRVHRPRSIDQVRPQQRHDAHRSIGAHSLGVMPSASPPPSEHPPNHRNGKPDERRGRHPPPTTSIAFNSSTCAYRRWYRTGSPAAIGRWGRIGHVWPSELVVLASRQARQARRTLPATPVPPQA
jgi:hypothetical protein